MALDLNDPELEFSDLVYAYQSWVMAVINDEKLDSEDKLLTDDIAEDALNSMRFLPGEGGILVAALAIGLVAALIPAIRIFRVDLATTLARYS